jgi:hypothetical protein
MVRRGGRGNAPLGRARCGKATQSDAVQARLRPAWIGTPALGGRHQHHQQGAALRRRPHPIPARDGLASASSGRDDARRFIL